MKWYEEDRRWPSRTYLARSVAENFLQQGGRPCGGIVPNVLLLLRKHIKQAIQGLVDHVSIDVKTGRLHEWQLRDVPARA
jgi:hypothetical protein